MTYCAGCTTNILETHVSRIPTALGSSLAGEPRRPENVGRTRETSIVLKNSTSQSPAEYPKPKLTPTHTNIK